MPRIRNTISGFLGAAAALGAVTAAHATDFNVPGGPLETALDAYSRQSGIHLMVPSDEMRGVRTRGVKGDLAASTALTRILTGTGFVAKQDVSGVTGIVRDNRPAQTSPRAEQAMPVRVAAAAASVETVVVTSSKIKGDIQTVPIAITALSQEQLTSRQIAGGPDLVKEVPNLTFSKTNFTGYNIQIRGIGTQAISVTTDPAVAVALNDIPFIRNHFFEQEFYDVNQVEVLRGPQGTLYGRNATAGVVNVISAKPTDQFEAMASADIGNYHNRRYEGMVNIPIVDDRLDLRVAGEWTKRDGYSTNEITGSPIDGRDLWSTRVSLGIRPVEDLQVSLVWEHFQESDDRMRTSKQLCKTAPILDTVDGVAVPASNVGRYNAVGDYLSQGCLPTSLYSADAFEAPNGYAVAYYFPLSDAGAPTQPRFNIYGTTTQSRNLRVIDSALNPIYKAKNDTLELNADYQITPALTFTSQTGYNNDFLWSTEDYNRFNSAPGAFKYVLNSNSPHGGNGFNGAITPDPNGLGISQGNGTVCTPASLGDTGCVPDGVFCDPQLGCSDRLVAEDLSDERAWQLSQEFRLASNFSGPLNFSIGGNYLHYETEENYYVFINSLTLYAYLESALSIPYTQYLAGDNTCAAGHRYPNLNFPENSAANCPYIDPNPLSSLNNMGHNYFLSQNPYTLNSYAGFGEAYYQIASDLKLTGGVRWTQDQKHFVDIPSQVAVPGYGYAVTNVVNQQWNQLTGRAAVNWTPKLDFTDQTLVYGSFAHGYKAGGANPPGAIYFHVGVAGNGTNNSVTNPIHPLTFKPEFIDSYELGTKNTLLDGALTVNGDVFYYNYKNYQISRIVDRTAINDNFNATVKGAELETNWEPAPGLKFSFAGGYEDTRIANGQSSIDLMDRTAGTPGWVVVKPFVSQASNCILPAYVLAASINRGGGDSISNMCGETYFADQDPVTEAPYVQNPAGYTYSPNGVLTQYPGFDPLSVDPSAPADVNNGLGLPPNNGEGFAKPLGGNQLPNAPHFTTSLAADYTLPVSEDWAATLHSDFYWQSQSFARVFNDRPYDKIRGYSTTNLALILTSASGWQVMGYLKNVFNVTAITGDFLNSDDSSLTTNVFLTDPRLYGVRITKNF